MTDPTDEQISKAVVRLCEVMPDTFKLSGSELYIHGLYYGSARLRTILPIIAAHALAEMAGRVWSIPTGGDDYTDQNDSIILSRSTWNGCGEPPPRLETKCYEFELKVPSSRPFAEILCCIEACELEAEG